MIALARLHADWTLLVIATAGMRLTGLRGDWRQDELTLRRGTLIRASSGAALRASFDQGEMGESVPVRSDSSIGKVGSAAFSLVEQHRSGAGDGNASEPGGQSWPLGLIRDHPTIWHIPAFASPAIPAGPALKADPGRIADPTFADASVS